MQSFFVLLPVNKIILNCILYRLPPPPPPHSGVGMTAYVLLKCPVTQMSGKGGTFYVLKSGSYIHNIDFTHRTYGVFSK